MGRDKALIEREGEPLAVRVAAALRVGGCHDVWAAGGDERALRALGLEVLTDRFPGQGPLGGLATALAAAPLGGVLVLAPCDVLDPDPRVTRTLLTGLSQAPPEVEAAVPLVGGRLEWIHSAWRVRRGLVGRIDAQLEAGRRRLDAVSAVARSVTVEGIAARALADADRPEDLAAPGGEGTGRRSRRAPGSR